jgi:AraC-like DNA-binding protein
MNIDLTQNNINELKQLLIDFHTLTGMKVSVYDNKENELYYYPEKFTAFCRYLRDFRDVDERCQMCDRDAMLRCKRTQTAQIYTCHAGLIECFTPIIVRGCICGFIAIGQVRGDDANWDGLLGFVRNVPIDTEELERYYRLLPIEPRNKIEAAVHILEVCAGYERLKKIVEDMSLSTEVKLEEYVGTHTGDELSVTLLCRELRISRRELYLVARNAFGCTPAEFIRSRRLKYAAELLKKTEYSVGSIADKCGIGDYNYFSKLFKRSFGMSPRRYRRG